MNDSFLVIDTETSGLFDFSKPAEAEGQPRLASATMIFCDRLLEVERVESLLVKPDGWVLGAEAAAVNGLTMERLADEGVPVVDVLDIYEQAVRAGRAVIAFNAQYDCKVMRGELRRAERDDMFPITRNICVMRPCTDICQIPNTNRGGFKFPKLAEALKHFGIDNSDPHTAHGDAHGALAIARKLREMDMLPAAGVHLAKAGTAAGKAKAARPKANAEAVSATDELPS
jgi:DNA polymerase III epsilon subunit-like protein